MSAPIEGGPTIAAVRAIWAEIEDLRRRVTRLERKGKRVKGRKR